MKIHFCVTITCHAYCIISSPYIRNRIRIHRPRKSTAKKNIKILFKIQSLKNMKNSSSPVPLYSRWEGSTFFCHINDISPINYLFIYLFKSSAVKWPKSNVGKKEDFYPYRIVEWIRRLVYWMAHLELLWLFWITG